MKEIVIDIAEDGEILVKSPGVFKGYFKNPEDTEETIVDGWLHSGDLGTMNEHGYVRITGRIKDMIIRGGENIYPAEIENFLMTHPDIEQAQVIGVPDEKYGEEVCAWIKLEEGASLTEDEVKAFCTGQITHFKVPKYVRFVDEFPMTVTGKIQKFRMSEAMAEELASAA